MESALPFLPERRIGIAIKVDVFLGRKHSFLADGLLQPPQRVTKIPRAHAGRKCHGEGLLSGQYTLRAS
jgi:hypothetical protein